MDLKNGQHGKQTKKILTANDFFPEELQAVQEWTKKNADVYQELDAAPHLNYLENYIHNWSTHLHHINRIARVMQNYGPTGKISLKT